MSAAKKWTPVRQAEIVRPWPLEGTCAPWPEACLMIALFVRSTESSCASSYPLYGARLGFQAQWTSTAGNGRAERGVVVQRILIVEDDRDVVRVVEAFLEREGFAVEVAEDGLTGLDAVLERPPELVVLDWMLPHLDGPAFLRRLRRERSTPVIMLTARTEEEDRVAGLDVGADDYVTKPFSPRELVARVKAVLRRLEDERHTTPDPIERRRLRIDPLARTVQRDGARAHLTAVEFDLLWALAREPGRVFRREDLLDRVWGDDFVGIDRVVDVHVSNLRQKLAPLGAADWLVTVRGVGYKFE